MYSYDFIKSTPTYNSLFKEKFLPIFNLLNFQIEYWFISKALLELKRPPNLFEIVCDLQSLLHRFSHNLKTLVWDGFFEEEPWRAWDPKKGGSIILNNRETFFVLLCCQHNLRKMCSMIPFQYQQGHRAMKLSILEFQVSWIYWDQKMLIDYAQLRSLIILYHVYLVCWKKKWKGVTEICELTRLDLIWGASFTNR